MKQSQLLAVMIVCGTWLTSALAESQSSDLYAQGKSAYNRGDCESAIEMLTRYKVENEGKLKNHVEFSNKLNDAIHECEDQLEEEESEEGATAIKYRDNQS